MKKGAEVRKVKRCRTEDAISLPQLGGTLEHGSCPERNRTLERFGQCTGVEGGSGGRQLCLLTFSHTMNQDKLSAPDCRRLKAKVIADPKKLPGSRLEGKSRVIPLGSDESLAKDELKKIEARDVDRHDFDLDRERAPITRKRDGKSEPFTFAEWADKYRRLTA
jgi:hypothetical protein